MCCNRNSKTENWRFSGSSFILYCAKENQDLIYVIENRIVLEKNLHTYFHKIYKFGGNTIDQFQDFLLFILSEQEKTPFTLISSQANPEGLEGSETRAYDPERVMKLHERLERVLETLYDIVRNSLETRRVWYKEPI
uniref:Putative HNH homing endonuclease n=1 Tax=Microglena monadina TaxID=47904 RepID=A0A0S2IBQ9_9CHLO|nr:putative HNH homing endonuclease [Microglena monadina]